MHSKNETSSDTALMQIPGVGKQIAKYLARLEIHSLRDLLFHFPTRYQDRTRIQKINTLIAEEVVVEGTIKNVSQPTQGRTKLLCELNDATGSIYLRFFHVLSFQIDHLKIGTRLRCYGEVRRGKNGWEMIHPEFRVILNGKEIPIEQHLTPFYPATEGLSQYMMRKLTTAALEMMHKENLLQELLPDLLLQSLSFPTLQTALQEVHRPPQTSNVGLFADRQSLAHKRLIFEELLAHRMSLLKLKHIFQSHAAIRLVKKKKLLLSFRRELPFQLTKAQERVIAEISNDLAKPSPMLRLVQGDVGSGKTVIAALAMLQAVQNGYQAAMMAPTELLAEQHFRVFKHWLEPLGISVVLLSGYLKPKDRAVVLDAIQKGTASIVLGTHALFQKSVQFAKLAFVVIDEQHRFGVHQRALLREKGMQKERTSDSSSTFYPHQLVMTATPIPRTLAMSFYADLDCSIIDELPPGRTPIMTSVVANTRRNEVIVRIKEACQKGRQAYWVCPLIEESEASACQAAAKTFDELKEKLPELRIGLIHGRLHARDKEAIMHLFQKGELHLLVATTVIEVGVDVPNASLMIIENAERLGLSQLHQLRGRVGRGKSASHCVLLYQHPLSPLARERLSVMRETVNGFKIAERDLELRGPGEVLGTKQTGALWFRIACLIQHSDMLPAVHKAAELILREHPAKVDPLIERWLGGRQEYSEV